MNKSIRFRKATPDDVQSAYSVIDAVRGKRYCVWDENYPLITDTENDAKSGSLFVLELEGNIIGTLSISPENEFDDLDEWQESNAVELSRIAVLPEYQGHGYALKMVTAIEAEVINRGFGAIHLLAAVANPPAVKTYEKAGYRFLGTVNEFDCDFHICEKLLGWKDE